MSPSSGHDLRVELEFSGLEAGNGAFVGLEFGHFAVAHEIGRGVGAGVLHLSLLEVDGNQSQIHAVGHLVFRLEAAVLSAVKDVSRHFVQPVENLARLGIHLADVLEALWPRRLMKAPGTRVPCNRRRPSTPGIQFVEPRKSHDAVAQHVQDELSVEDAAAKGIAGQDGTLNALGVVDAGGEVRVELADLLSWASSWSVCRLSTSVRSSTLASISRS